MILITGGAGFIGSHLADLLIEKGYRVRILDNLHPQVHSGFPSYLNKEVEFIKGDVREREILEKAIEGVEGIFHFAARVGVGQSMYEVKDYVEVNVGGTASLLDILVNKKHKVKKLIVASSMSIYGEGAYNCKNCGTVYPRERKGEDLKRRIWEPRCPHCGEETSPLPTSEEKPLYPSSIYAQTKREQEEMCLLIGKTYGIPTVALRFFNVFGSRQALSNPYTGVVAIFASRILNGKPPVIYEDGQQLRDFIHVKDIARASLLALEREEADYEVFNVGTGRPVQIKEISRILQKLLDKETGEEVTFRYRKGDIRTCYADVTKIKKKLGFEPEYSLEEGMKELVPWLIGQKPKDEVDKVIGEMEERRLME